MPRSTEPYPETFNASLFPFTITKHLSTVSMSHVAPQKIFNLSTEAVESASLSLERVDNIERGDSLALGMFCVCDGITND